MLKKIGLQLLALSIMALQPVNAHDSATAHYLGNEGVMVVDGETKILFDAFYASSFGQYTLVPDNIVEAMKNGEPPFDGVDAVFVSHAHGDHFTPSLTLDYLRAQKDVVLFAPTQVIDALKETGIAVDDPLHSRLRGFELTPTDLGEMTKFNDMEIDVVSIPHAGNRPEIQNYAWRVALTDNTRIIHFGDAGTVIEHFDRHKEHFDRHKTNIAFPPYWFMGTTNGDLILREYVKADQVIGVHVPARSMIDPQAWRTHAGGDLFTSPGETRQIHN